VKAAARWLLVVGGLALVAVPQSGLLACSGTAMEAAGSETRFPLVYGDRPTVAQLVELGRRMFFDPALSASGRQSCATCHDPRHAYGPPNALAVQPGGPDGKALGFRAAPALAYLHSPIAFTEHFYEVEVTGGRDDQGPTGGRTWDGRVNTGHDQALMPLLDAREMANESPEALAGRLRHAPYAQALREAVSAPGEDVFADPEAVAGWAGVALATFEQLPQEFHPFTSKYDAWLRDETELSPRERRGLALFNDLKKGNCASCHPSTGKNPTRSYPSFTDFGYVALGVPRNRELPANDDPAFHDLGLCGPLRTDLHNCPEYCGLFRTPTLRNVALRQRFFHNGAVRSLRDAVAFYATRDLTPERWYPRGASGRIQRYDDLPERYQGNINKDVPFKPLPGGKPRLSAAEIDDIVAFLRTLTDGWTPLGRGSRCGGSKPADVAPPAACAVQGAPSPVDGRPGSARTRRASPGPASMTLTSSLSYADSTASQWKAAAWRARLALRSVSSSAGLDNRPVSAASKASASAK
jgi:cytochrome c peroxidase